MIALLSEAYSGISSGGEFPPPPPYSFHRINKIQGGGVQICSLES